MLVLQLGVLFKEVIENVRRWAQMEKIEGVPLKLSHTHTYTLVCTHMHTCTHIHEMNILAPDHAPCLTTGIEPTGLEAPKP